MKIAAAGGIPILVARIEDKLEETKAEIERGGRHRVRVLVRPLRPRRDRRAGREDLRRPRRRSTCSSTTRAARSGARVELSYDRFHDYERTIQLNYLGTIKLIIGAAAAHARAEVAATSSTSPRSACRPTRRASRPTSRSKAALDAFTRVVELGDDRRQRHVHDDPHAARADADDRADQDLRQLPDDLARRGRRPRLRGDPGEAQADQHRLGTFGEVAYALAPKAVDQILHMAYKVFPESTKKDKGEKDGEGDRASGEAMALAHLMKGVHW